MQKQQQDLAELMRMANRGDASAYRHLLELLAPRLRAMVRRGLARAGRPDGDCEDIVQEVLLAVHLKRQTWDESLPLEPWLHAIMRYKLVDAMRRQGFRQHLPIDAFEDLAGSSGQEAEHALDADDLLSRLPDRQRRIVIGMAMEGRSAREVGESLGLADGAVRVALHRALKSLADIVRKGTL